MHAQQFSALNPTQAASRVLFLTIQRLQNLERLRCPSILVWRAFVLVIISVLALCSTAQYLRAQSVGTGVVNSGTIVNIGSIAVLGGKSFTSSSSGTLTNTGFQTEGVLTVTARESAFLGQNSIGGWVRFTDEANASTQGSIPDTASNLASSLVSSLASPQRIPMLLYAKLFLGGRSTKIFGVMSQQTPQTPQTLQNIACSDSLIIHAVVQSAQSVQSTASSGDIRTGDIRTGEMHAQGDVLVRGAVTGTLRFNGRRTQNWSGIATIANVVIDNPIVISVSRQTALLSSTRRVAILSSITNASGNASGNTSAGQASEPLQSNEITELTVARRLDLLRGECGRDTLASVTARLPQPSSLSISPIVAPLRFADSCLINRTSASVLSFAPQFGWGTMVRYVNADGTDPVATAIVSSGELPSTSSTDSLGLASRLARLEVLNSSGVQLAQSVTVRDSLVVASRIFTGASTLTFAPRSANPVFQADSSEIIGAVRRIVSANANTGSADFFQADTTQKLTHNRYTFVQLPAQPTSLQSSSGLPSSPIAASVALGTLRSIVLRVQPDAAPEPNRAPTKIRRSFVLTAQNARGDSLPSVEGFVRVGYAWRVRPRNETNDLQTAQILLQRWQTTSRTNEFTWQTAGVPQNPAQAWRRGVWNEAPMLTNPPASQWIRGVADSVRLVSGFYALGTDPLFGLLPSTSFVLKTVLEGAYSQPSAAFTERTALMHNALQAARILPLTPPNTTTYPFSLLASRDQIPTLTQLPDSVVDWVLVELRRSTRPANGFPPSSPSSAVRDNSFFLPALLKRTGAVVGTDGRTLTYRRSIYDAPAQSGTGGSAGSGTGGTALDVSGSVFVVIHHRNHLPVASATRQALTPNQAITLDFTDSRDVFGGEDGIRLVGRNGSTPVFAMSAGDVNADGMINRADYDDSPQAAWNQVFSEGYVPSDCNLDGVVTTADANFAWNNRGKNARTLLQRLLVFLR
jgi:hypothetical protein